jgi:hypothetical protein
MAVGTDGANPFRIGANQLEHRTGLLETTGHALVGGVKDGLFDRTICHLE